MANRDVDGAIKWLKDQSKSPSQSWKGLCQSSCRQAYGLPAWAPSATQAWHSVKDKYKVKCTDHTDKSWWAAIPRGAIIYSTAGQYGHAWIADDDMTGWSVDYKRNGYIDRVEIRLKGWNSYYAATAGYITGCQWYKGDGFFEGLSTGYWDSKIPPLENVMAANDDRELASAAAWRLACRLSDLGYGKWKNSPVKYTQVYPAKAMIEYNEKWAPDMADLSQYGPKAHERIFEKGK
jgi:hypothetical protein